MSEQMKVTKHQEYYDRVKKHPDAIVLDVGEAHPIIISQHDQVVTYTDYSEECKTIYYTFEYVKKHLKELKACDCMGCRSAVTAYRLNKKARRGATPEEINALLPNGWTREWQQ